MKTNQWAVLGLAFFVLMIWFIFLDRAVGIHCVPTLQQTTGISLAQCISAEILDPFIYIFFVMMIVCWVNGWLEDKADRKK